MILYKILEKIKVLLFRILPKSRLPEGVFTVVVAGCGHVVKGVYTQAFNRLSNVIACVGLYSKSIKSAICSGKYLRYKTRIFNKFEDIFLSDVKSIIITLPNHLHYKYIKKAINGNKDIFCEKPLVNELEEAFDLKRVINERDLILMVGFNQRYSKRILKLKQLLNDRVIGEIIGVDSFHNQDSFKYIYNSKWMNDVNKSGGGVIHNAGIHLVNTMLYLFGGVKYVEAKFMNVKLPVVFGEDTADCKIVFSSGIKASLKASYVNEVNSSYEHMIIYGSRGTLFTDMRENNIIFRGKPFSSNILFYRKNSIIDSFCNELSHFMFCVESRKCPNTDINDFIDTLKIVKAIYLSAREKRKVLVNEFN